VYVRIVGRGVSAFSGICPKMSLMCAAGPFQPKSASSVPVNVTRTMRGVRCSTRFTVAT
jgi:hypothetical protein